MGKGTTHIILVLISGFCKFLEFRNNQIVASCTFTEWSHVVMNLFTSIYTENNISHFFVAEFHNFVIEKYTVCCQCKTEFLIVQLLLLSSVCHQILDNLPVHQRLSSEEIDFQILSGTRIRNQKIKCFLSYFKRHQRSSSMIFAFLGKAVSTGQITVVGNVQAQRFDYCLSIFSKFFYYIFVYISGKQHTLLFQLLTFRNGSTDISFRILILQSVYDLLL